MSRRKTVATVAAAMAVAVIGTPIGVAQATGPDSTRSRAAPLCRTSDVSYYYGGSFAGMGHRSFQLTLLAHDGVQCRLSDRPGLMLAGPPGNDTKIPFTVDGRGATLLLTPAAPLHTTISWLQADSPGDTTVVDSLKLRMPGGGVANSEPFQYPGHTDVATVAGVHATSWTTGIGAGEAESS